MTVFVGAAVPVVVPVPVPVPGVDIPAVAVTLLVLLVVSTACAVPVVSVCATDALNDPLSVVNVTGTPGNALPLLSKTFATTVEVPPLAATCRDWRSG